MFDTSKSEQAYQRAIKVIPGGVNSPVRAALAVDRNPVFLAQGKGSSVWDVDGNRYIDYVGSWGPLICGHAHPHVIEAIQQAAQKGTTFGAPTEAESALAEQICKTFDSIEKVRLVNSGTEATMSALRLARGVTQRDYVVKFEGCYHGHADSLLVKAGSGALTMGVPSSGGVPKDVADKTLVAQYNDIESVRALFDEYKERIAAVIIEPVAGNMGVVAARQDFLTDLRDITQEQGSLLIVDEVMTGFRVAQRGATSVYGIDPDLICLGKVIGGGLPLAAFGGKSSFMDQLAPLGPVYQAGTLSGNPLAVAAGLATLELLQAPGVYENLFEKTMTLACGIREIGDRCKVPLQVNQVGAMFSIFFSADEVVDYSSASRADAKLFSRYYRGMLEAGVYLAPSQFEAAFVSTMHTDSDISLTLKRAESVISQLL